MAPREHEDGLAALRRSELRCAENVPISAATAEHIRRGQEILSVSISVVLLAVYASFLLFSLRTHSALFSGPSVPDGGEHPEPWPLGRAIAVLAGATVAVAWLSEILVGAIEPTAHALGLSNVFVGVFVVAILGNAAEHATRRINLPSEHASTRTVWPQIECG